MRRPWLVVIALSSLSLACPAGTVDPGPGDSGTPPASASGLPSELRPPTPGSSMERPPEGKGLPEHLKPPR
ncbi:hypothetical protein [Cystobacter fuscus]|uniref:hypothetical protein n=1 Tax=Cystobacter fuscus TaxID=43 RepID=UPI0012FDC380|nr:hypothetical protein [Cystobacter fuscus]